MRFTKNTMNKKTIVIVSLILVFQSMLTISVSSDEEIPWWNNDWGFRQEIPIPIDTSNEYAKFQPIDLKIVFDNPCWAKNEKENSVRVVFQQGDRIKELESQIYNMNYTEQEYIKSCNLVFLIPDIADGSEKYFVYYSDTPKKPSDYKNHVDVDESYYSYEPVTGLFFKADYYKIIEDGFVVYAVTQEGEAFNGKISQQVTKLKKESKYVMPNRGDQLVSFDFIYWWLKNGEWYSTASSERLISKQVFVDGNLMVKFGITSGSNNGLLQSKVIYKYYYSPLEEKKIYVNVTHKVVDYPLPKGEEIDVAFATINCGGIKSSIIDELNFGEIPPFLHFYSDRETVASHEIEQYPENENWQMIIGKKDDCDIGNESWLSVDYGETGKAHGLIFDSNNILESGENERDGIELQMYESHSINLPGLDGCFACIYAMRNAFEENEPPDEILPRNYVISFNAEFLTTEKGGYKRIREESYIYKKLISSHPEDNNEIVNGENNQNKYDLTVYPFLSPSLAIKYLSSKLLFKHPYIGVELYKENELIAFSRASRIVLKENYTVDWGNISMLRNARFPDLNPGEYLIKIYLENLLLKEKEFIGYKIVDLQGNKSIRIPCKPEGHVVLDFYDQNNNSLEKVETYIIKNNTIIAQTTSGTDGKCEIRAPTDFSDTYLLRSVYKGFLIDEEEIKLKKINSVFPYKKTFNLNVYDFKINFRDSQDKIPDFDVDITLTSKEMKFPVVLKPDIADNGFFEFKDLYSSNYTLSIKYNNFEISEKYYINKDFSKNIKLQDLTLYVEDNWGLPFNIDLDVSLIHKEYVTIVVLPDHLSNGTYGFTNIYPGEYTIKINYNGYNLEKNIVIPINNSKTSVVFPVVFNLTLKIYDSHGNVLNDADVLLKRDGKETHGVTSDDGRVLFEIPPGRYKMIVNYSNKGVVADRYVDVLNDKTLSVITVNEPLLPLVVLLTGVVFLLGFGFISFKKRNIFLFLGCLVVFLAVLSTASPWWGLNGSSSDGYKNISTSTNLYMSPLKMVTITSYNGFTSGTLSTLDESFVFVMNALFVLIIFGCILVFLNILSRWCHKKRLELVSYLLGVSVFVVISLVFVYAMSEFANAIVGGLSGSGNIDVLLPGEGVYETLDCSWGVGTGFYLMMISMVVLFSSGFVYRKTSA